MAFEITLEGKVFIDGEEFCILTKDDKKTIMATLTIIMTNRKLKELFES